MERCLPANSPTEPARYAHLNTVYVTSEDAWVRKDGANVVVEVEGVERGRVPIHMIGGVICFTRVGMSPR